MKKIIFIILIPLLAFGNAETPSPNMAMPIPTVGVTTGPRYATDINNSLLIIDKHDHSPGYGVPITPAGINLSSDLTCHDNNLTNIRTARFFPQGSPLALSSDIGALYESGVDLYYNDGSGNQIRITQSGTVAGSAGTITGLPSGTASAAFSAASGTFIFQQASSTGANIDAGTYVLRYPGSYPAPSGNYIALEAPASLATGFALIYPPTLPGTTGSWMTSDTSGTQSWTKIDNSTLNYASNIVSVKNQGITAAQILNNTITATQIANNTITGQQISSNTNFPGKTTSTDGRRLIVSNSLPSVTGLAVVRATFNSSGTLIAGEGATATSFGSGTYSVSFSISFSDIPIVMVTVNDNNTVIGVVYSRSTGGCSLQFYTTAGNATNATFSVLAIGQD